MQAPPMSSTEKTYDNLIKYDRAIAALKRAPQMERLIWSNELFLSADDHCKEQFGDEPNIFTELIDENNHSYGK